MRLLARLLGQDAQRASSPAADQLAQAVNLRLWDKSTGAYFDSIRTGKHSPTLCYPELPAFRTVPEQRRESARGWL